MELKEIKEIVAEIVGDTAQNKHGLTYRKYNTFLQKIGMGKKRNFAILKKFDYQFKKEGLTLWCGKEEVKSISDFRKGETVTFRPTEISEDAQADKTGTKVNYKHAGTVTVVQSESGIVPYQHQHDAFYNLGQQITKADKNPFAGLLVLPTGGGKTLTAAHWIAKNYLDKGKKVLWLAHRHELLEQAKDTFAGKLAYSDIFKNRTSFNYRLISGNHDKPVNIRKTDDLIISSKDSLNAGFDHLYNKWIKNNTDEIFLVVDEAHHATAKTYRKLIDTLREKVSKFQMLGLTATPFRTEEREQGLLAKVFPDDIVYKIDLRTLIRLGILSEPHFEEVGTGYNFIKDLTEAQIENLNRFDIDSIGGNIAKTIAENRERNNAIVSRYVQDKAKYKQTLVFALNVDNAIALNKLFLEAGVKSDYVISAVKDAATGVSTSNGENKDKIAKFRAGETEVLVNVNILTEGTDVPNVQSVFLARPTISSILMTQMIGRGLRGTKAGGTKEAYIVSFVDDCQHRIQWVNPEKLFIEDNTDFNDAGKTEVKKQLLRLVAISKIEEFAMLADAGIDTETKKELEKLAFIRRFPVGIYQFRFLEEKNGEPVERACEVLVYDNLLQSYRDFINALPDYFKQHHLTERDWLTEEELETFATEMEEEFFAGRPKYPAYDLADIKNILQYYTVQDVLPPYTELKDREQFDIDKIADEIIQKDLGERAQTELKNTIWTGNEVSWETFFNFDKRAFLREIDLAKGRILHPEIYQSTGTKPTEEGELRSYENLSLSELREQDPPYEKELRDRVFRKFTDAEGYYFSAQSGFRSKSKLPFQIDHIKPMHQGGLTVLENLQVLTRKENGDKGSKG